MKANYLKRLLFISTFSFCFLGCSNDDNDESVVRITPGEIQLSDAEKTMVGENNDFGFYLFKNNLLFYHESAACSPVNVGALMGMLANGMQGKTLRKHLEIMNMVNHSLPSINRFYAKLLANAPLLDEQATLAMTHGIYGSLQDSIIFNPKFIDCLTRFFQADVQTIDFSKTGSVKKATDWLKLHSNGMDVNWQNENEGTLLQKSFADFNTKWKLTSANAERREVDFMTTKSGEKQSVKMTIGDFLSVDYTDTEQLQAVNLPLGQGKINMLVLMPREDASGFWDMMWEINDARVKQLLATMQKCDIHMELPDIAQENSVDLTMYGDVDILNDVNIFGGFADFDPMLQDDCRNTSVRMASPFEEHVRLNISAEVTTGGAIGESTRQSFVANRPFGYIVYDKDTCIIFFIGMYYGQ